MNLKHSTEQQPHPTDHQLHSTDQQPHSTDHQPHSTDHSHSIMQHVLQWATNMLPPTLSDFDWLLSELPGEII